MEQPRFDLMYVKAKTEIGLERFSSAVSKEKPKALEQADLGSDSGLPVLGTSASYYTTDLQLFLNLEIELLIPSSRIAVRNLIE